MALPRSDTTLAGMNGTTTPAMRDTSAAPRAVFPGVEMAKAPKSKSGMTEDQALTQYANYKDGYFGRGPDGVKHLADWVKSTKSKKLHDTFQKDHVGRFKKPYVYK